jgi:hypothetical protein
MKLHENTKAMNAGYQRRPSPLETGEMKKILQRNWEEPGVWKITGM